MIIAYLLCRNYEAGSLTINSEERTRARKYAITNKEWSFGPDFRRGAFFRSLLEYSFMKHLEEAGVPMSDVQYECFRVPWQKDGRQRTYKIDFYVPDHKIAYEVKMSWACKHDDNQAKWAAAQVFFEKLGIAFKVMTENDFRKISFEEAASDEHLKFIESSFKSFKRKT